MNKIENQKVKTCIETLIEMFKTGNVPELVSIAVNPALNVPSNKWSLANKIIQMLNLTSDARGFRQWEKEGRRIKKNSKSFSIFAPYIYQAYQCKCNQKLKSYQINLKICPKCKDAIDESLIKKSMKFMAVSVFRAEDTEGKPLSYEQLPVPKHRFVDVAKLWGLEIKSVAFSGGYYGYYRRGQSIALASPDELVFYHELAHAAHHKLGLIRNKPNNPANEIVAEFVSAVLVYMDNSQTDKIGNAYQYLKSYAEKIKKPVEIAVTKLLSEIEAVISLVLSEENKMFEMKPLNNPVSDCDSAMSNAA